MPAAELLELSSWCGPLALTEYLHIYHLQAGRANAGRRTLVASPGNHQADAQESVCCATGSIGAARNLEALRGCGVTHVVNASPIVPCFHRRAAGPLIVWRGTPSMQELV